MPYVIGELAFLAFACRLYHAFIATKVLLSMLIINEPLVVDALLLSR